MKIKQLSFLSIFFLLLFASACDNYNQVLKSDNVELKYEKAKEYYNQGKYFKAIPLLDELISIYRGKAELEDIYYIYCYAHYGQGNYLMAAYNFKNYYTFYPGSEKAEEAMFMVGKCYYQVSPDPELDQEYTLQAINAFQLFINSYPNSERVPRANEYIRLLRKKLERKAFDAAKLYYDMGQYQAAAISFENILFEYPDIAEAEYVQYLIVKSKYLFAKNSIESKQAERYNETIEAYRRFKQKYPESEWINDAKILYVKAQAAVKPNKAKKIEQ